MRNALFKNRREQIKTLVDEFVYPRLGAGQVYEMMAARIEGAEGRGDRPGPRSPGCDAKAIASLRQPLKAPPDIMTLRDDIFSLARRSPISSRWPGPKRRQKCCVPQRGRYAIASISASIS